MLFFTTTHDDADDLEEVAIDDTDVSVDDSVLDELTEEDTPIADELEGFGELDEDMEVEKADKSEDEEEDEEDEPLDPEEDVDDTDFDNFDDIDEM